MSLKFRRGAQVGHPLALVLLIAAVLPAQGRQDAETDVTYVPDDAFFAMLVRPGLMLEKYGADSEAPVELVLKTARENAAVDVVDKLESFMFVVGFDEDAHAKQQEDENPRVNEEDWFSMVMRFSEPVDQAKVAKAMFDHTELAEHDGKKYYQSKNKHTPSVWFPDEKTLVVANDPRLRLLMKKDGMGMGSLRHHLRRSDPQADGAMVLSMDTGRAWFKAVLGGEEIPLPLRPILELPTHLDVAVITADLAQDEPVKMFALAVDEKSAKYLTSVTGEFVKTLKTMLDDNRKEIEQNSPTQNIGTTTIDLCAQFLTGLKLEQEGRKIRGTVQAEGGMVAAAELVVEMFAFQQRQSQMWERRSRLHPLGQALQEFRREEKRFPAAAIRDEEDKPLLSWRVQLLLHIGQEDLYKQFKLDEPWDSDHNKKLLKKMPALFAYDGNPGGTTTRYLAATGEGTLFADADGLKEDALKDDDEHTIAVVEVPDQLAVPWTKPADFAVGDDALEQLTSGGDQYDSHFLVVTADGDVSQLKKQKLTDEALKGFFTVAGEEELLLYRFSY